MQNIKKILLVEMKQVERNEAVNCVAGAISEGLASIDFEAARVSTKNKSKGLIVSTIIFSCFILLGIHNFSTNLSIPKLLLNSLGIFLFILLLFLSIRELFKR
ncbi:hypothetical protein [Enterococcus faecium]|uniref:hypothetical protein n=1 Tax=Enterococcus faecium TaxID=1352 RepID=UPI0012629AB1|nr:hypothetical protein [Enterococcus faecium]KAB7524495.1 hypothetical protein F8A91_07030 [Enterococcus faecium]